MTGHPEFELTAEACITMFVGTFPEIHRHIKIVDECFCASESEYGIVGEVCSGAEHLHLIIIFYAVTSSFVSASRYITYCLAYQIILHTHLTFTCCKDNQKSSIL
jgi:hypothetical protein